MLKKIYFLVVLVMFVVGCSKSVDSLAKQALQQFVGENYNTSSSVQIDKIKVLRSELISTDMNVKHYQCLGLVKLKCTADRVYESREGVINPGEAYFEMVYVKLNFDEGSTGVLETRNFNRVHINSKDGAEIPLSNLNL